MGDFVKDLDELKISFRGYDKEEVMIYIKELLQHCEKEKKKEMEKLLDQNRQLQEDLKEARNQKVAMKEQYDALLQRFEKISDVMSENTKYTAERDAKLDEFQRKQDMIETLVEQARKDAEKEKELVLSDTKKECSRMLEEADKKKEQIIANANDFQTKMAEKADSYVQLAKERAEKENLKVRRETEYMRRELEELAKRLEPILYPDRKPDSGSVNSDDSERL